MRILDSMARTTRLLLPVVIIVLACTGLAGCQTGKREQIPDSVLQSSMEASGVATESVSPAGASSVH